MNTERLSATCNKCESEFKNLKYYVELSANEELSEATKQIDDSFINFRKILNETK